MYKAIDDARIAADGKVKDWQCQIKPGDFYIIFTNFGITIYGEILDPDPGDDEFNSEEFRNYRLCRAFSVACETGEMGSCHVSQVSCLITKELFEKFREQNWSVDLPE